MATITGRAVVFGVKYPRPITNIPPDALKVRLRLRPDDIGMAFVKFQDRVEQWSLSPTGNIINAPTWELGLLQGVNVGKPMMATA